MKNENLVWGFLLILIGVLFLGENLDWWHLSLHSIAKFWPFLLILAGINYILSKKYNLTPSGLTGLLIFFAIPLGISSTVQTKMNHVESRINDVFDNDDDDDDNDDESYSNETNINSNYPIELGKTEVATLKFNGGAAEFETVNESEKLFLGKVEMKKNHNFKLSSTNDGNESTIDFSMESFRKRKYDNSDSSSFDINLEKGSFSNKVKLGINKKPIWNFDINLGAGEGNFDLSDYKVKDFTIHTGAAAIDLKLGDKLDLATVLVESGVAKVQIEVPEGVGCKVTVDGGLNSKDFDNFEKISSGLYQTSNYEKASKKINITLKSGLSALEINRY